MLTHYRQDVRQAFDRRAAHYDNHSDLQQKIAHELAELMPLEITGNILEIGCGTGHLTKHLIKRFPNAALTITDISPDMVRICAEKYNYIAPQGSVFEIMDGERPDISSQYDLIVSSMCMQWFTDPLTSLNRLKSLLKPNGQIIYATIGKNSFQEWKDAAASCEVKDGFLISPDWPAIIKQEHLSEKYDCGLGFLRSLKAIGANRSALGYQPLSARNLKKVVSKFDALYKGNITWHIVYGKIENL